MFQKFLALFTFLGVTTEPEQNQNGVFIDEPTLTKIDELRTNLETATTDLTAAKSGLAETERQFDATKAKLTETEGLLTTANSTIATRDTEITGLKAKLTGKPEDEAKVLGDGTQGAVNKKLLKSVSLAASQVD